MSNYREPETCAEHDWVSGVFVGADDPEAKSASPKTRAVAWLWSLDAQDKAHVADSRADFIDRFAAKAEALIASRGDTP